MVINEVSLNDAIAQQLIALSEEWEKENSCYGYHKNNLQDLECPPKRIFIATEENHIQGYLFGHYETTKKDTSICKSGSVIFEIDELFVKSQLRNRGVGKALFQYAEKEVSQNVNAIFLSTATKNFSAILHFYIDELGMEFWSTTLFKTIKAKNL